MYRGDLADAVGPVPMGEEVQDGFVGPLALIKIEPIFLESTYIDDARRRTLHRPSCLAQVIDAGPHKIACNVIMNAHKLPQLLHIDVPCGPEPEEFRRRPSRKQIAIISSDTTDGFAFRSNETPLRQKTHEPNTSLMRCSLYPTSSQSDTKAVETRHCASTSGGGNTW